MIIQLIAGKHVATVLSMASAVGRDLASDAEIVNGGEPPTPNLPPRRQVLRS